MKALSGKHDNRPMRYDTWGLALLTAALLSACNPVFNWREARFDNAPLVALLPCKPDKGVRSLPVADRVVEVSMQGCEAGGVLFTVAVAQLASPAEAGALLGPWKSAMLANARTSQSTDLPLAVPGATPGRTQCGPASAASALTGPPSPRRWPCLPGKVRSTRRPCLPTSLSQKRPTPFLPVSSCHNQTCS